MTLIPEEVLKDAEEKAPPQDFYHQWLYSVVPARESFWHSDYNIQEPPIGIYLTGYCKVCNTAFTVPLGFSGYYQETHLNIPKTGCVPPQVPWHG